MCICNNMTTINNVHILHTNNSCNMRIIEPHQGTKNALMMGSDVVLLRSSGIEQELPLMTNNKMGSGIILNKKLGI